MKPDLSVIIPAYNEEAIALNTVAKLDEYFAGQPMSVEALFVDDGSHDRTAELLVGASMTHATKRVVRLSRNFGSHAAIRAGFRYATADKAALYFMDMVESPEILGEFYQKLCEGYGVVASQRIGYKPSMGSRIYSWLQKKFICPDYPEDGISTFALNERAKCVLNENAESDSSVFLQIYTIGFRKCLIPSRLQDNGARVSRWTLRKKITLLVDSFCSFSHTPIHVVSGVGCAFALCGILYAMVIIVIRLFGFADMALGFPMLISVLLVGFGITNIALGVIAEYLVRVLDASRRRPAFIVDRIVGNDGKDEAV